MFDLRRVEITIMNTIFHPCLMSKSHSMSRTTCSIVRQCVLHYIIRDNMVVTSLTLAGCPPHIFILHYFSYV